MTLPAQVALWIKAVPMLKCTMDFAFGLRPKLEREFQQLVERTNNSNSTTDYFVCDIEYTQSDSRELRADLLGLQWPSTELARKGCPIRLAILEMKFADGALANPLTTGKPVSRLYRQRGCYRKRPRGK